MTAAALEARDLVVTHRAPARGPTGARGLTAVAGVSLALARGEVVGLTGESGCGKSSLARALVGMLPVARGQALIDGHDLARLHGRDLRRARRLAQLVFQDPGGSLDPRLRVAAALREALRAGRAGGAPAAWRDEAAALLAEVGLPADALAAWPHELSGGQRQRVALARALAARPLALVADEPTAALDVTLQARVLGRLLAARAARGLALLLVSHDWAVVTRICDRVAVMYLGLLVEVVPGRGAAAPQHPYARALAAAAPSLRAAGAGAGDAVAPSAAAPPGEPPSPLARPAGCPFHPRCALAQPACRQEVPVLEELSPGHLLRCPPALAAARRTL